MPHLSGKDNSDSYTKPTGETLGQAGLGPIIVIYGLGSEVNNIYHFANQVPPANLIKKRKH